MKLRGAARSTATRSLPVLSTFLGCLAAPVLGCGAGEVPHGAPVLENVYWDLIGSATGAGCLVPTHDAAGVLGGVPSNQCLVWSKDGDSSQIATVPPAANQFNLVFDRVLDGSKIEDTITDGGVSVQYPKLDGGVNASPVTVDWPGIEQQPQPPPLALVVWYNSVPLPFAAAASSYVYGRARSDNLPVDAPNPTLTFPSNTTITIHLDHTRITSKYNEPMIGPETITVKTAPFSVLVALPAPASDGVLPRAPVNYWVPLEFSNRVGDLASHVQVTQNGRVLSSAEYRLVPDPTAPTRVQVRPIDVRTTPRAAGDLTTRPFWDDGARVEVTLDATLPDVYGAPLGQTTSAAFIASAASDAGVAADGGASTDSGSAGADAAADGRDGGAPAPDTADDIASGDSPASDTAGDASDAD
jgi:hypothetical protein